MNFVLQPLQLLLLILAGWINRHQQNVIDYLKIENEVIREQLRKKRILLTNDQRRRLAIKECLDHVIVLNERSLPRIFRSYFEYYHGSHGHLGLNKDAPDTKVVEPPDSGRVVEITKVGGLHYRHEWCLPDHAFRSPADAPSPNADFPRISSPLKHRYPIRARSTRFWSICDK